MRHPSVDSLPSGSEAIRVAYDVSPVASFSGASKVVTGVGRIIEEQLWHLRRNPDLDIRITGGFGGDWNPVITCVFAQRWAATVPAPPIPSLRGFKTRSVLGDLAVNELYSLQERAANASSPPTRITRLSLAVLRRLAHALVEWRMDGRIDVYHATFRSPPAWLPARLPRVVTVYDLIPLKFPAECGPDAVDMSQELLASLNVTRDVLVAVSNVTKKDLCTLTGFPPERVLVAHPSASETFRPLKDQTVARSVRDRLKIGEHPFILSVSNLQARRNVPHLIRSFYRAVRENRLWPGRLVLVENVIAGSNEAPIVQAIDEDRELSSRVLRIGGITDADLAVLYGSCEAFVFPSLYEGFGLPVLEALQCAAPVICSNVSSLLEVVGEAGLPVDPKDEVALADAITRLTTNSEYRMELSEKGVQRAAAFSWEASAKLVADAYSMAAGRNKLRP